MQSVGIKTGDIAAQAFSGANWKTADNTVRIKALLRWLEMELSYLSPEPKLKEDTIALRFFALARNHGWCVGDEDTPKEYCTAFVDDNPLSDDAISSEDIAFWHDEFKAYQKRAK